MGQNLAHLPSGKLTVCHGKSTPLLVKTHQNGGFSMAILVYRSVVDIHPRELR